MDFTLNQTPKLIWLLKEWISTHADLESKWNRCREIKSGWVRVIIEREWKIGLCRRINMSNRDDELHYTKSYKARDLR